MKNKMTSIILVLMTSLLLSACQTRPVASSIRPATQTEMAAVKQEWIDKKCNVGLDEVDFVACATVSASQMPVLDMNKREQFGERYDPKQWLECVKRAAESGKRGDGACDDFKLRRIEDPAYWPNPNILPIKWPISADLPKKPSGMSNKDYFQMLCKTQAGEFIYRTVDNVEGLFQIRPIHRPSDQEYGDRYALEDPYSVTRESGYPDGAYVQPKLGKYQFIEVISKRIGRYDLPEQKNRKMDYLNITSKYVRFYRDESGHTEDKFSQEPLIVSAEPAEQLVAKYGYIWRGLGDKILRDQGIAAGEQAVVDISTGEVLAVRRSFLYSDLRSRGRSVWWMGANHCSQEMTDPTDAFVKRVLKPIHAPK